MRDGVQAIRDSRVPVGRGMRELCGAEGGGCGSRGLVLTVALFSRGAVQAVVPGAVGSALIRFPEVRAGAVPVVIDTVAWVRLEDGRILCARPRGRDIFYVPGGKREGTESDLQTLLREITEELAVALLPETVTHVGTYEAGQPSGDPDGALVRMSCYNGDYSGTLAAISAIDELACFSFADRPRVPPVDQLLFDDLKAAGELR